MESVEELNILIDLLSSFKEAEKILKEEMILATEAILKLVKIEFNYLERLKFIFIVVMLVLSNSKYENKEKIKELLIVGFKNINLGRNGLKNILGCIEVFEKHKDYIELPKNVLNTIIGMLFDIIIINKVTEKNIRLSLDEAICKFKFIEYIPFPTGLEGETKEEAIFLKKCTEYLKGKTKIEKRKVRLLKRFKAESLEEIMARG